MYVTRALRRILIVSCTAALLTGCATPAGYSTEPLQTYDKNTDYRIDERAGGFTVTIYYSRYQFIPESDAVATTCKSALTSIAYDHADNVGKEIEHINEQRIKLSMGRNGVSGITSCSATVPVKFKK